MGGSRSNSSQATSTTTISDSYNRTLNQVENLSDVGNVKLSLGGGLGEPLPSANLLLPLAGLAVVAVVGVAILMKKS